MTGSSLSKSILPEQLHRTRRKHEPGCALVLGGAFTLATMTGVAILTQVELNESPWPYYALCAIGGVLGFLLLWSWFVQTRSASVPPAVVELSEHPLVAGHTVKVCVRQEGPVDVKTLRANLVCLRQDRRWVKAGATTKTWVDTQVYDQNLIDASDVRAFPGGEWNQQQEFHVPTDQPRSRNGPNQRIKWRIEVWVRIGIAVGKMHSFDVNVIDENEESGSSTP